jgi:DNA-binding transcriptional ArsR family regulator
MLRIEAKVPVNLDILEDTNIFGSRPERHMPTTASRRSHKNRSAQTSAVFHALADPTRRAILERLRTGEHTAGELTADGASQSAVSQHLSILRSAGLVTHWRSGRHRYYGVDGNGLRPLIDWVAYFDEFWNRKLTNLADYLDSRK